MIDIRSRIIKKGASSKGPVIYWMSRDQRVADNWALLFAQQKALEQRAPLVVIFCLVPAFLQATIRQYGFMLKGLKYVEEALQKKNIAFHLLMGSPEEQVVKKVRSLRASCLVTDFDPLRVKRKWKQSAAENIHIPLYEVDAHNIVPCWRASPKQEYAAYTFRPKVTKLLADFLHPFRVLKKHPFALSSRTRLTDWEKTSASLTVNRHVGEVSWLLPGEKAAKKMLRTFIRTKLSPYSRLRNDPSLDSLSNLSPYLHFGHISAQRIALEVESAEADRTSREAYLEELIVRRELSDNFCYYNDSYDRFSGFPSWAQASLDKHRKDRRVYTYSAAQLEQGETHDDLWNAAQKEMVCRGKMHGYMRMYWAKKILEWSGSPEEALKRAIDLNDRYELDGRDPNGYVGAAWSIGGVHDRAWNERPIFGKVRYMSYNGCLGKFDIRAYISRVESYAP